MQVQSGTLIKQVTAIIHENFVELFLPCSMHIRALSPTEKGRIHLITSKVTGVFLDLLSIFSVWESGRPISRASFIADAVIPDGV